MPPVIKEYDETMAVVAKNMETAAGGE